MNKRIKRRPASSRSWDPVADWYLGWAGAHGSRHHRQLAIPAVMDLLAPRPGERVLDLGCGPGALAPAIARAGARYTGVDASPRMIAHARKHHAGSGTFLVGDVTSPSGLPGIAPRSVDGAVYLLSLQDIHPLQDTLRLACDRLRAGGRLVALMTHPCFRIPRQSGWGWDRDRKLQYRRVDRYLTPLQVPMQPHSGGRGTTRSYHRPLSAYIDALAGAGMAVQRIVELAGLDIAGPGDSPAQRMAQQEIPLFLGIRAIRL